MEIHTPCVFIKESPTSFSGKRNAEGWESSSEYRNTGKECFWESWGFSQTTHSRKTKLRSSYCKCILLRIGSWQECLLGGSKSQSYSSAYEKWWYLKSTTGF